MENLSLAEQLIDNLLQIKAIRMSPQNPFTWASGWKSPVYCDNRKILSYPIVRDLVKGGIYEMAKNQFSNFNCIAGVATAGIAWGQFWPTNSICPSSMCVASLKNME